MIPQAERTEQIEVTPTILDAMRRGDADRRWLAEHPRVLEPYRGEWVVVHRGRIVAHSPDGSDLTRNGDARTQPGALVFRVPTKEEAEAVRIL